MISRQLNEEQKEKLLQHRNFQAYCKFHHFNLEKLAKCRILETDKCYCFTLSRNNYKPNPNMLTIDEASSNLVLILHKQLNNDYLVEHTYYTYRLII